MRKFKLLVALKVVRFGLWLYEANIDMHWDDEDRSNVKRLWEMHDEFSAKLAKEGK